MEEEEGQNTVRVRALTLEEMKESLPLKMILPPLDTLDVLKAKYVVQEEKINSEEDEETENEETQNTSTSKSTTIADSVLSSTHIFSSSFLLNIIGICITLICMYSGFWRVVIKMTFRDWIFENSDMEDEDFEGFVSVPYNDGTASYHHYVSKFGGEEELRWGKDGFRFTYMFAWCAVWIVTPILIFVPVVRFCFSHVLLIIHSLITSTRRFEGESFCLQ